MPGPAAPRLIPRRELLASLDRATEAKVTLVLAPAGSGKLRLAGELAEIGAADLRFTEQETSQLLEASGIALSEARVAKLHQRAQG